MQGPVWEKAEYARALQRSMALVRRGEEIKPVMVVGAFCVPMRRLGNRLTKMELCPSIGPHKASVSISAWLVFPQVWSL